jgi:hypothetical protein
MKIVALEMCSVLFFIVKLYIYISLSAVLNVKCTIMDS